MGPTVPHVRAVTTVGALEGRVRVEGEASTKARDAKTQQKTMPYIRVYKQAHTTLQSREQQYQRNT